MILIQVTKNSNESPISLLRRFNRKVQDSGIIRRAKSLKYNQRELSFYKRKMAALKKIESRKKIEKLKKLGKIKDGPRKK